MSAKFNIEDYSEPVTVENPINRLSKVINTSLSPVKSPYIVPPTSMNSSRNMSPLNLNSNNLELTINDKDVCDIQNDHNVHNIHNAHDVHNMDNMDNINNNNIITNLIIKISTFDDAGIFEYQIILNMFLYFIHFILFCRDSTNTQARSLIILGDVFQLFVTSIIFIYHRGMNNKLSSMSNSTMLFYSMFFWLLYAYFGFSNVLNHTSFGVMNNINLIFLIIFTLIGMIKMYVVMFL